MRWPHSQTTQITFARAVKSITSSSGLTKWVALQPLLITIMTTCSKLKLRSPKATRCWSTTIRTELALNLRSPCPIHPCFEAIQRQLIRHHRTNLTRLWLVAAISTYSWILSRQPPLRWSATSNAHPTYHPSPSITIIKIRGSSSKWRNRNAQD